MMTFEPQGAHSPKITLTVQRALKSWGTQKPTIGDFPRPKRLLRAILPQWAWASCSFRDAPKAPRPRRRRRPPLHPQVAAPLEMESLRVSARTLKPATEPKTLSASAVMRPTLQHLRLSLQLRLVHIMSRAVVYRRGLPPLVLRPLSGITLGITWRLVVAIRQAYLLWVRRYVVALT